MPLVYGVDTADHNDFTVPGGHQYSTVNSTPIRDTSIFPPGDPCSMLCSVVGAVNEGVDHDLLSFPSMPGNGYLAFRYYIATGDTLSGNLIAQWWPSSGSAGFRLFYDSGTGGLYWSVDNEDAQGMGGALSKDEWHWVEFIAEAFSTTQTCRARVDGVEYPASSKSGLVATTCRYVNFSYLGATHTHRYARMTWGAAATTSDWLDEDFYAAAVMADNPNLWYRLFDPSAAAPPTDLSGNDHDCDAITGTMTAFQTTGPITEGGEISYGQTFSGSSGHRFPNDAMLDVGDVFTMEAWVKRGASQGTTQTIFMRDGAWQMYLSSGNKVGLSREGVAGIAESTTTITDTTTWHHVVITKNGSDVHIYIDGVDVTGTVTNSTFTNTSQEGYIGNNDLSLEFLTSGHQLSEVALYPTALSASRVLTHYEAAVGGEVVGSYYQRVYGPGQLAAAAATLYTVPENARVELRSLDLNNPSGSLRKVTLSIGSDAAGTRVEELLDVPAGGSLNLRRGFNHTLEEGEFLQGYADSASVVVATIGAWVEQN